MAHELLVCVPGKNKQEKEYKYITELESFRYRSLRKNSYSNLRFRSSECIYLLFLSTLLKTIYPPQRFHISD